LVIPVHLALVNLHAIEPQRDPIADQDQFQMVPLPSVDRASQGLVGLGARSPEIRPRSEILGVCRQELTLSHPLDSF
jgi:hypothetical protein